MLEIDKTDELYKYLTKLGVEKIDEEYLNFAQMGRFRTKDVKTYINEFFKPSSLNDIDEKDLELILDYYNDIKQVKKSTVKQKNELLKLLKKGNNKAVKQQLINDELKDCLLLCVNYKTMHKDVDLQDLIQTANIGLVKAIDKFDPEKKLPIKDYVAYYVREKIMEEFKEKNNG